MCMQRNVLDRHKNLAPTESKLTSSKFSPPNPVFNCSPHSLFLEQSVTFTIIFDFQLLKSILCISQFFVNKFLALILCIKQILNLCVDVSYTDEVTFIVSATRKRKYIKNVVVSIGPRSETFNIVSNDRGRTQKSDFSI